MTLGKILHMQVDDIPYGPLVFLITMLIAGTFPWYGDIYYRIRKLLFKKMTKKEQKEWAVQVHFDLFDKLLLLRDDPFMSDHKWREWPPICRYSDQMLKIVLPETQLMSLESFVSRATDEPDETRV